MSQADLLSAIQFTGRISRGQSSAIANFSASVSASGRLVVRFDDIIVSNESKFILFEWHTESTASFFELRGTSKAGDSLVSNSLYFTSVGHGDSRLALSANCAHATINRPASSQSNTPAITYFVRGFQCYGRLHAECQIGNVFMAGAHEVSDYDSVAGAIVVTPTSVEGCSQHWSADATKLLDHVLKMMSFASGTYLRAPVRLCVASNSEQIEVYEQSLGEKPFLPPFHFLNLQPFFGLAVSSFWDLAAKGVDLSGAIEWMLMPVTYNELHLLCSMTALEHLVSRYGGVPPGSLSKAAICVQQQLRDLVKGAQIANGEKSIFLAALGRLSDPPLRHKIDVLLAKWSVPMADMPPGIVAEIVGARNDIVHRGIYYDTAKQDQKELWYHILLLNELLSRVILAVMNFSGSYFSYIGECHQRSFPQCVKM